MLTDLDYRHCRRWFLTNKTEVPLYAKGPTAVIRKDCIGDVCLGRLRRGTTIVRLIPIQYGKKYQRGL